MLAKSVVENMTEREDVRETGASRPRGNNNVTECIVYMFRAMTL